MSDPAPAPVVQLSELRLLCAAADLELPAEDLPALARALAQQRTTAARLRRLDLLTDELDRPFDPDWS